MKLDMSGLEFVASPLEVHNTTDEEATVKPDDDTTIVAFIFEGGVMVAADTRASMSSQSLENKIIRINPYMLLMVAGGDDGCPFLYRYFCIKSRFDDLKNDRRISVARTSKLMTDIIRSQGRPPVELMIAGWDETGPGLFLLADFVRSPARQMRFSVGSGSSYANGVLDKGYHYDMSIEEAAELAKIASGGVASGSQGWKKLSGDNIVSEPHQNNYPIMPKAVDQKKAMQTIWVTFIFKGGLIVAAGSRASVGDHNSSQSMKKIKINEITPCMLTVTGGATPPKFWSEGLRRESRSYEQENNRRFSVRRASKFLGRLGVPVGTMIAGWDETGPELYYSDDGKWMYTMWFCIGSGPMDANDVLSNGHRYDMSTEEAAKLAERAIGDGASSSVASVYHIGPQGWKKLSGDNIVEELQHKTALPMTVEQQMAEVAGLNGFVRSTKNYIGFI